MQPIISVNRVSVPGRLTAFSGEVRAGERLHLVGPNGAGKSTLLACMAGLMQGQGEVILCGEPINSQPANRLARRRAFSPQLQQPPFSQPLWHFLALHQAALDDRHLEQMADALQLTPLLTRAVNTLSGGEWQRARLAGVLLQLEPSLNPQGKLLLLDEPYNNLDIAQQSALDQRLDALCRRGLAVVLSSHDLNHTLRRASTVWLMHRGEKVAAGSPEQVLTVERLSAVWPLPFRALEADGQRFILALHDPDELPASPCEAKLP